MVKESTHDNQVIVQPGRAWFNHTWSYNSSDMSLTMPAPESFLDRIDAVVLDVNSESNVRANSIGVIKGTPSDTPQRPTLIRSEYNNQYPLCYVYRHGGQNHINKADITNAVGTSECPFVIGLIEGITVDDLIRQWKDEYEDWFAQEESRFFAWMEVEQTDFEKWMEDEKRKYAEFLTHNYTAWTNWFMHIHTELDGDVAGHLQQQIDWLGKFAHIYVVDKVLYVPMNATSIVGKKLIIADPNSEELVPYKPGKSLSETYFRVDGQTAEYITV